MKNTRNAGSLGSPMLRPLTWGLPETPASETPPYPTAGRFDSEKYGPRERCGRVFHPGAREQRQDSCHAVVYTERISRWCSRGETPPSPGGSLCVGEYDCYLTLSHAIRLAHSFTRVFIAVWPRGATCREL